IMLARGETGSARAAAEELQTIADAFHATFLQAVAAHAEGAVLLNEGNASAALNPLRKAWSCFSELEAPYEAARVRFLLGRACRELGDEDGAGIELASAKEVFLQLGAMPDARRVDEWLGSGGGADTFGLSPREIEVLRLVAVGESNRSIAARLFISERTVERHLSNILAKLNVPSRTAAAAFAIRQGLA